MNGTHAFYLAFDLAIAVVAVRSILLLRRRAPLTAAGWVATLGYALAAASGNAGFAPRPAATSVSFVCLLVLTVAFVAAGIRDEPQAEPWWWPVRLGKTRAERRAAYREN